MNSKAEAKLLYFERELLGVLRSIDGKMGQLLATVPLQEAVAAVLEGEPPPQTDSLPQLIEVKGMEADWVINGLVWEGKHEVRDEKELTDFLGFNPNGADPDGKSWCAGFWLSIFKELGFDVSELNLMATSFKNFGYALDEVVDGAICVFEPKEDADFPIRHVGVAVDDCTKLFGGNQGTYYAKRSNFAWYLENADLTAIRCPDGYQLV